MHRGTACAITHFRLHPDQENRVFVLANRKPKIHTKMQGGKITDYGLRIAD